MTPYTLTKRLILTEFLVRLEKNTDSIALLFLGNAKKRVKETEIRLCLTSGTT
jgi:hypothetical protein